MRKDEERRIMEEELLYPPRGRRHTGEDDGEYPPIQGGRQKRSFGEMREKLRSDGRRVFRAIDRAYKIPDQICKGIEDFYNSFSRTMGNKPSSPRRRRRRRR